MTASETHGGTDIRSDATAALRAARAHLVSRQAPAGWWKGELRTNVTMDAEDLLLRRFLGILRPEELAQSARWIRREQRADGTWATFVGGPGDLSTTIEAYAALRLAGDEPAAPHMQRAAAFVRAEGGIEASRVFTRIWLALFGEWSWDDLPAMPPEVVLLPSWAPLNVYDWGCWARQTVVPITVVATLRPVRPLPFTLGELHGDRAPHPVRGGLVGTGFTLLDRVLKLYEKAPIQPGRGFAMKQAAEWIIARQEDDGGWGGIQPPWVYSILALHLLGYSLDHPVLSAAVAGLDTFLVHEATADGIERRLEACQSPVWDTCLAANALLDAGATIDDPELAQSVEWILGEEIQRRGDWAVRRPGVDPGGWAFEFANDGYPDVDDTAEVVLALDRVKDDLPAVKAAVERGIAWVKGMQSSDGGWGAFDADNTRRLVEKLPFCDFGAVIDPPSADVTAHAVEMLARCDDPAGLAARRGVRWLLAAQEDDGSWFGRWGNNYVYGTGAVVPALVAAGVPTADPAVRRAVDWLVAHQNADGGWGEDLRSYVDDAWRGRGESTPSQTAWALLALLAAGESGPVVDAGVAWLVGDQRPDGGWDEESYTGTGFPGDFYISYEMYRLVFPISALGRYLGEDTGGATATAGAEVRDW
ncbi:squalene-hopene/tetraprenyl-beta-curcumene cyclase [Jatrophihabitans endophyticus]|uniref:Squalene-hopene/tetraprenyl-beta-curcumene cyclase n=1 Tax=Jatrophihabitans endophyticus TaxID=1206085 RepID=A0A1M5M975_9ACTN|nr:squalene--hopene cyclase [Jatrophihabitans endophyticus]SHG73884.1 squalene-hopene/tetraprenyl-beta-curcumene cyclase [Jatrophihabitans endophyticus]